MAGRSTTMTSPTAGSAIIDETAPAVWPYSKSPGNSIRLGDRALINRDGWSWWEYQGVKHDGLDRDGIPHVYLPAYQSFHQAH